MQNKTRILLTSILLLTIVLSGIIIYFISSNFTVPKSWAQYSNKFYGYSFSYDPTNFIIEVDPYGSNDGEDLSVLVNKVDSKKLDKQNMRKNFFSHLERGSIPDHSYVSWQIDFSKPRVFSDEELTILKRQCKKALFSNYLTCHNYLSPWVMPLNDKIYVTISATTSKDQKLIKRILNSIRVNPINASYLSYPSKNIIERSILSTQCARHSYSYNNFDACENGLRNYEPYYISNSSKILKTLTIIKPFSYCQADLNLFPNVTSETCPYTNNEDLYASNALGKCNNQPLCNVPLPENDVFLDTPAEKTKALNSVLTTLTPSGWKYFIRNTGNYAFAAPANWLSVESKGDIQAPKSDNMTPFTTITLSDPNHTFSVVANDSASLPIFTSDDDRVKTSTNLGKFYCGRFASCDLIRYKSDNPIFKVTTYEYALVKLDQANYIKTPPQLLIYVYNAENASPQNLNMADSIVKTYAFLTIDDP